jgi:hypothetical protein
VTREERRALMPESSAFIDDMRENFGELLSIDAQEGGVRVKWEKSKSFNEVGNGKSKKS